MSEKEPVIEAANKLADYLHVLLAVEYDVDVVDRLAKSRRLDEFTENMYNALRRRLNLESKLENCLNKVNEQNAEYIKRAISIIKSFNPSHVEVLRRNLAQTGQSFLREVATYVGARALASTVMFDKLREIMEKIRG